MVSIEIADHELIIHNLGWDKILAFRGEVRVPLAHVADVRARPAEAYFDEVIIDPSIQGIGVYRPGKAAIGTVALRDGRSFYNVRDPRRAIAIDLIGERLRHLVVEVEGEAPEATVRRIEKAVGV